MTRWSPRCRRCSSGSASSWRTAWSRRRRLRRRPDFHGCRNSDTRAGIPARAGLQHGGLRPAAASFRPALDSPHDVECCPAQAVPTVPAGHRASGAKESLEVAVVGHQFWWEYRYPGLNVVTANELHVRVGTRTFLNLLSADTDHSFWVPRLAGKTDLIPNHPNRMWIEPR